MNFISSGIEALLPLYRRRPRPTLPVSETGFGLLWPSAGVGSPHRQPGVADSVRRSRVGRGPLLLVLTPSTFDGLSPLTLATSARRRCWSAGHSHCHRGCSGMIWNVITVSLRQAIVPDQMLGRINAGYRLMAWGSMPAGAAAAGLGAELIGARAVFAVLGGLALLLVIPMLGITEATIESAETGREPPVEKGRVDTNI